MKRIWCVLVLILYCHAQPEDSLRFNTIAKPKAISFNFNSLNLASLDGGLGFRYLIARKLRLSSGIDIAKGPEDWAIYFTVGSSL